MSNAALWSQANHTLTLIGQQNPTLADIKKLQDGYLTDLIQAIQRGTLPPREDFQRFVGLSPQFTPKTVVLEIDYSLSFDQMVAAGRFDWNKSVNQNTFPIKEESVVVFEARTFLFEHDTHWSLANQLIKEANDQNPWTAAKIEHLLAFGAKCPDEQRKFPILAIGSTRQVPDRIICPSLRVNGAERCLSQESLEEQFDGGHTMVDSSYRFLAVRKKI